MIRKISTGKRPLKGPDYALLEQKLCGGPDGIPLDKTDLEVLRNSGTAFCWESPLAISVEEAADMAEQAAADMAPEAGRLITASILYIVINQENDLTPVEQISGLIQPTLPEAALWVCGVGVCGSPKGIRFLLATAEGEAQ